MMNVVDASKCPGRARAVVLVDDDDAQRKLVKVQLQNAGFIVIDTKGAVDAESILDGFTPHAIVSDVLMDDVDGFTFCRRVRSNPRLARVPVVLISASFDEEDDRTLAKSLGAAALVERSPGQAACIEALVSCLDEGTGREAAPQSMPAAYDRRLVHQLSRLFDRNAQSEARYQMLFEHANDAISLTTAEGIIVDVNRKWTAILGLDRESARGRSIRELVVAGHEDVAMQWYAAALAGGSNERIPPTPVKGANGTVLLEFTTATLDLEGQPMLLSIGRDVTSLVETEAKLAASERLYRSLVENMPDVVWSATRDWKFTYLSPNIEKMCGFTPSDIYEGKHGSWAARVHPDDLERVREARAAMTDESKPFDIEYRWQHRDGRWLWVHLRAKPNGDGIDGLFSDVTARRELETQLFQAQKLEAVGQLVAGVAHDFNNTLAVVAMNASMIVESLDPNDPSHEIARDVVAAAAHGSELTKQLLAFSRPKPHTRSAVYLDGLLGGISRMLARTLGSAIRLDIRKTPGLWPIEADPAQIEQLVMNLAVNARDAMNRQGKLEIRTACVELDAPRPGERGPIPAGRWVRLSITDTGAGMDEETRRQIFEPFFTTKRTTGGTGLGLSICHGIVRHSSGYIEVESKPGEGTTFHVYFPRLRSASYEMVA